MFLKLAYKSLLNRKGSVVMTLLAISVAIFVLLGIEHIRHQAKSSFASTVSGVDLIVGSRTGSLNLLLYSVFRIGAPTNNISWASYQEIAAGRDIAWSVPISLGDSHRGFRVMGTTPAYFEHFSYGNGRALAFAQGKSFESVFDVVLGAEVARSLAYTLGQELTLSHGVASASFSPKHNEQFTVVGVLAPTGTPVDQTVHVRLAGIEAIHAGWQAGMPSGPRASVAAVEAAALEPESITAFFVGLNSRIATFRIQRTINTITREPLMAILPGVALSELWQMVGMFENTLRLISVLVLVAAVLGLGAMLLASVRERREEIQLLRVIGAPPLFLFLLMELEALLICLAGLALGALGLFVCLELVDDWLFTQFGLYLDAQLLTPQSLALLGVVLVAALVVAAIPSVTVYNQARDGRIG